MSRFPGPGHLASWAGVCPGHHESAGKRKSGKTRHGDRWLTGALGTAALAAARTRDSTYLGAKYRRLAPRIGKQKAIVALQHSILAAVCAHVHRRRRLPGPGRRLFRPPGPRTCHAPHRAPSQRPRIHRTVRPHPSRLTTNRSYEPTTRRAAHPRALSPAYSPPQGQSPLVIFGSGGDSPGPAPLFASRRTNGASHLWQRSFPGLGAKSRALRRAALADTRAFSGHLAQVYTTWSAWMRHA